MAVTIKNVTNKLLYVNDKPVMKDFEGNWVTKVELTTAETEALYKHLKSLNHG